MYRLLDRGSLKNSQDNPYQPHPAAKLGPKVNPPVTLKPKLKSLPILSSVERLSEL